MTLVKPLAAAATAIGASIGIAYADHPFTTIEIINDTNKTLNATKIDAGGGSYAPQPTPLSPNSTVMVTHQSAYPSASGGRIEYAECDFFFSKVSSIDWWTGNRTWPTFNATATDNRSWDGIDCDAQKVITNFFTGEYYIRFSITQ